MSSMKTAFLAAVALILFVNVSLAAPIVGGGWDEDSVSTTNVNSTDSPYVLALLSPVTLSITDAFVAPAAGDIYTVYDNLVPILTTAFNTPAIRTAFGDNLTADNAWVSALYTHGQVTLGPGAHSITIQASSLPGGQPAGFFVRLDAAAAEVPEPASIAVWSILSVAGAAIYRRKRRKAAESLLA